MPRIQEIILEPDKIYVGSNFKLKIKIENDDIREMRLISEDNKILITEDNKIFRTEWS